MSYLNSENDVVFEGCQKTYGTHLEINIPLAPRAVPKYKGPGTAQYKAALFLLHCKYRTPNLSRSTPRSSIPFQESFQIACLKMLSTLEQACVPNVTLFIT